jgi:predicted nucleic acid-binding protein
MILLDTGFFVALLEQRDELHRRAAAWGRSLPKPALVTEYVLWETLNYFGPTAGRGNAWRLVERLRGNGDYTVIPASEELFEAGLRLYGARADKQWSLTDCISIHLMGERHIRQALSYDQHFEQAGFEALLRRDP